MLYNVITDTSIL